MRVLRLVLGALARRRVDDPPMGRPTPRRSPPWIRGQAVLEIEHAEHTDRCGERSDNAIRSQSRKSGADEKYLVGGPTAT